MCAYAIGTIPYTKAWDLQRRLVAARSSGEIGDLLLLLEHPPTITLGRAARREHLLAEPADLERHGVEVIETDRGGDITFHGPGQIVGYPIVDLRAHRPDMHWYLRTLEQALISFAASVGVKAHRCPPHTGVWVGDRKLAAIGVHARHWVTSHGFALNVSDLREWFDLIVPCGLHELGVTSLQAELGYPMEPRALLKDLARCIGGHFPCTLDVDHPTVRAWRENCRGILADALDPGCVTVLD